MDNIIYLEITLCTENVFSDLLKTQFFVFNEYDRYFSTPPPHTIS